MTSLDDLVGISTSNQFNIVKTGRGVLRQVALVIPVDEREMCFNFLGKLETAGSKWQIPYSDGVLPIQIGTEDIVTNARITNTRVYETRIVKLDEPDPRKIAMAKKRLRDCQEGKLTGTPTVLLEKKLKEVISTPLRAGVEKIIRKQLRGHDQKKALATLTEVNLAVISNVESAPNRLRMTWKDSSGKHQSKTLSSGVSIFFEAPPPLSHEGWLKNFVKAAKDQGAWVDGIFFPKGALLKESDLEPRQT